MFDTFLAVPLHFTIEFLGLLVMAGGAFLVASRPALVSGTGTNRFSATLGFAALAIAQVAHGGSFLESDADQILITLKTFGFALILIGVVGGVRQTAAAAAVPAGDPLLMAPVLAAAAVALMSFVSSFRGATRDLRRLALGVALIGASEAVVATNPPTGPPDLSDTPQLIAHVLRAIGYLALSSWLWTGVRSSIRTRFVASFVALLVVVVLALSTALTGVITNNVEAGELDRVSDQLQTVARSITRSQVVDAAQDARIASGLVQQPMESPGRLSPVAAQVLETQLFEADFVLLMTPQGVLRGSAGEGPTGRARWDSDEATLSLLGLAPVLAVRTPRFEDAGDVARIGNDLAIVGVAEVKGESQPDRTVGMIALIDWIDALAMDLVQRNVAAEGTLIVGRRIVASSLRPRDLEDVAASDLLSPGTRRTLAIDPDNLVSLQQELPGQT